MLKGIVLSGYGFGEKGPFLRMDKLRETGLERSFYSVLNESFGMEALNNRYCTGIFDLATLESNPCPNAERLLNTTNTQCIDCFNAVGFNPAFYNVPKSEISKQQRAYNMTPHVVYLAYFASGRIKVGISSEDRKAARWSEQGARYIAHILSVDNAYEARDYEYSINELLNLPETVLGKKKRQLLSIPLDHQQARKELEDVIVQVEHHLNLQCRKDCIVSMEPTYNPHGVRLQTNLIDLSEETTLMISGKCVAMYGDILVMENDGQQFILAVKKMISHQIRFYREITPIRFTPQQTSLF